MPYKTHFATIQNFSHFDQRISDKMSLHFQEFWKIFVLLILCNIFSLSHGTIHIFLPEDAGIFSDCDDKPDALGLDSIFDMSNLEVEILEESASLEGYVEVIWDVEPTDRVDFKADLLKSARGGWQPTVFSMVQKDFCSTLFEEDGFWYKAWGQFVDEEDRKCINHKGVSGKRGENEEIINCFSCCR